MALLLDGSWKEAAKLYREIINDLSKKESVSETVLNGEK